MTDQD